MLNNKGIYKMLNKKAKTILGTTLFVLIIFGILFVFQPTSKSVGLPNHYYFLDWVYLNESDLLINAESYYSCIWDNSSSPNKTCSPTIEIQNIGEEAVAISNIDITDGEFGSPELEWCYSDEDSSLVNVSVVNESCLDYNNGYYRSNCTVQVERISWGESFLCGVDAPELEIGPGETRAVKINFEMDLYAGANYNFTFDENRTSSTIILDPEISTCEQINSGGIYTLTDNLIANRDCIKVNSSDVHLDCDGYTITYASFASATNSRGIVVFDLYGNWSNISIENCNLYQNKGTGSYNNPAIEFEGGDDLGWHYNNTIKNNTIRVESDGSHGMFFSMFLDSLVEDNIIQIDGITAGDTHLSTTYGLWFQGAATDYSANNIINNLTIINDTNAGNQYAVAGLKLGIGYCLNNTFSNFKIDVSGNPSRNAFGIYFDSAGNHSFYNGTINSDTTSDIYVMSHEHFNFTNVTFNKSDTSFFSNRNGTIYVNWYMDVYANDSLGANLENVNVTTKDKNSVLINHSLTNAQGNIPRQTLKEYQENRTAKYYSTNYTVNGTKAGYSSDWEIVNLTTNKVDSNKIVLTLTAQIPTPTFSTPANNAWIKVDNFQSNLTTNMNADACLFEWEGSSNSTMDKLSSTSFGYLKDSLTDETYSYKAFCNSSITGLWGASSTRTINVDLTLPKPSFVSPTPGDGEGTPNNFVYINVSVVETNLQKCILTWNGTNQTLTPSSGVCGINKISLNGMYTYKMWANDSAGNYNSTEQRTIYTNVQGPTITYTSPTPSNNAYRNVNWVYVNNTATTISGTIDTCLQQSSFSGPSQNDTMTKVGTGASVSCYLNNSGLMDGEYTYKVFGNNSLGFFGAESQRIVTIDLTNPNSNYVLPTQENNTWATSTSYTIRTSNTDTNLNTSSSRVLLDGTNYVMSCVSAGGGYYNCSYTRVLTQGNHWYNTTITDLATNSNTTETRLIKIDSFNPSFSSLAPLTGTKYTDRTTVQVNFTLTETNPSITYLNWNGTNQSVNLGVECTGSGPYICSIEKSGLTNGVYTWSLWANDSAGNSDSSAPRTIEIDIPNPTITYVSPTPSNDTWRNVNWFTVNVSSNLIIDTCFVEFGASNLSMTKQGNYYAYRNFTGLADLNYDYKVYCNESTGGYWGAEQLRLVKIDTTKPVFSSIIPTNGTYYARNWFVVSYTLTETNPASPPSKLVDFGRLLGTKSNYSVGCLGGSCSINLTNLDNTNSSNPYIYKIFAEDQANNSNITGTYHIHIDNVAPIIDFEISTPSNNTISSNDFLAVNVTLDELEVYYKNHTYYLYYINGTLANSTTYTSSSNTLINWTGLSEGKYYYYVTERDLAGNSGTTETRFWTYDATDPVLDFVEPTPENEEVGTRNIVIQVEYDEINPLTMFLNLTSGSDYVYRYNSSLPSGNHNVTFEIYGLGYGNWTFYATLSDTSGRSNTTDERWVFINATSPISTLISPENNYKTNNGTLDFICNGTMSGPVFSVLANATLYSNFTGSWEANETKEMAGSQDQETFSKVLEEGYYVWNCEVCDTDNICDFYPENYSLFVDNTNPEIEYAGNSDTSGTFTRNFIFVNFSVSDDLSGVDNAIAKWGNTNYSKYNSGLTCDDNYCYKNFTGLSETTYNVTGFINDSAGNKNNTDTMAFLIDAIGPSISISSPEEGETLTAGSFPYAITTSHSISDNVALVYCRYNVTDQSGATIVANTPILCNSSSTQFYVNSAGSYYLNMYANTTNHETVKTRFFIVSYTITPGGGGGGEEEEEACPPNHCGNGVCEPECGETWETCQKDCTQASNLEEFLKNNWLWILLLIAIIIALFFILRKKKRR